MNAAQISMAVRLNTLKIATRKSPLALWQARHVKRLLMDIHPRLSVELVAMQTEGDRFLDSPLATVGGKGLFLKELESSLLAGQTDIAVHSMKDVTIDLPDDLLIAVILEREDSRDAFISNQYAGIDDLPEHATVGTSSMRRQSQLLGRRKDLNIVALRGNVETRLKKLDAGDYDAIILAAAGMKRLGLGSRISQFLSHDLILPAIGQGAIGIECCANDAATRALIKPLHHRRTSICIQAERAFSKRLQGGCQLPIAARADLSGQVLTMSGLVGHINGSEIISATTQGRSRDAGQIGIKLAEELLANGADKILDELLA